MLGTHDLMLFIVSGFLLNITPGADSLFIVTNSTSQGLKAGIFAALGISTGCFIHVLSAALGISTILSTYPLAFSIIKYIGSVYLIYIGLSIMFKKSLKPQPLSINTESSLKSIFTKGFFTNLLNPKVALFFLAFLPQFIESTAENKSIAFLFLGIIFTFNGTLWCLFLAWLSSCFRSFRAIKYSGNCISRFVGGLFVLLGIRLVLSK